jgi:N-acetyltransferase
MRIAARMEAGQAQANGTFRDSVVFSVLGDEWPGLKAGLQARLRV